MLADILHSVLHIFGLCQEMPLIMSALTIATQMAISHIIRREISKRAECGYVKEILLEFVASAELTGTAYELMIIANNYTKYGYGVFLFLMTIWWSQSWGSATACTYSLLEEYVETGTDLTTMILKMVAQLLGGIVSFRWVRPIWQLHLTATHIDQEGPLIDMCSADLTVPLMTGFAIELLLTCACRLVNRGLGELNPKFSTVIDSLFATAMVVLAIETSGGYFNPVLALVKLGCTGHTLTEYFIVYWVGSILGSLLSLKLWNMPCVHDGLMACFKPVEEKTKEE